MKKYYYLFLVLFLAFTACEKPIVEPEEPENPDTASVPLTEWEILDTTYTVADWTVPSEFLIEPNTAVALIGIADTTERRMVEFEQLRIGYL